MKRGGPRGSGLWFQFRSRDTWRKSAWASLGQSWTVRLRPLLWTALSASMTQANSSWIDWNRCRNPSQSSQKAFLTDLSITSLEKKGSSRNEEQLMGWLKKAVGELAPTFITLGTSCPLRMHKDQYLVWAGIWGLDVFGVVFFLMLILWKQLIDEWKTRWILLYVGRSFSRSPINCFL